MTEAELTRDFNKTGSTMSAEFFRTRLDEIREQEYLDGRARTTPVSPPAVAAPVDRARQVADEDLPVTYGFLRQLLSRMAVATREAIDRRADAKLAPLLSRVATLETRIAELSKAAADDTLSTRLSTVETRTAANSMLLASRTEDSRAVSPETVKQIENRHGAQIESAEKRLSRQGQHLAGIEDRLKALERGKR